MKVLTDSLPPTPLDNSKSTEVTSQWNLQSVWYVQIECCETKTKAITLANHKEYKRSIKPIKIRGKYL